MSDIVYVVEDGASSQAGIDHLLQACGYRTKAGSTDEILKQIPDDSSAHCIVMDIQSPDTSVPYVCDQLREAGSNLPIIFLTGQSDMRAGIRAIKAGAEDFFAMPVEHEEFIRAVDRALARHRLANERRWWERGVKARLQRMTRRERQVYELVVRGKMNKQVAFELGMTERTVKAHRHNVMAKMQVRSVVELVSCAERLGLSSVPL